MSNVAATGIPSSELAERRERLLEHCRAQGSTGFVLFDEPYIQYFAGFASSRPSGRLRSPSTRPASWPCSCRSSRSSACAPRPTSSASSRTPSTRAMEHPMRILARVLEDLGMRGAVGADQDGYPGILGYAGPALSEVTGAVSPRSRR